MSFLPFAAPLRPKRLLLALLPFGILAGLGGTASAESFESADPFSRWLAELAAEARAEGLSSETIDAALSGLEPLPRVLELDRSQPRKPAEFCGYLERRLTATRIARGQRMLLEHRQLLHRIAEEYGVPPRYVVALWGLETNFGDYAGEYPVIAALATLAYDGRRGDLFRAQLLAALRIVEQGHQTPEGMVGSWAGAMGQVQFMPTTFLEYAVDYDGDGRKDIWASLPDSFASAASYLSRSGWRAGETWGRQVLLPSDLSRESLRRTRSVAEWQKEGVRRVDGGDLPAASLHGSIVRPMRTDGPAFLVYRNYRTFLSWNNSTFFAISVGTLADELTRASTLHACNAPWPTRTSAGG